MVLGSLAKTIFFISLDSLKYRVFINANKGLEIKRFFHHFYFKLEKYLREEGAKIGHSGWNSSKETPLEFYSEKCIFKQINIINIKN